MTKPEFVHLHLHSHYSILDGVCQIDPLLDRAGELGMDRIALTDHGSMYGAIDFFTKAEKHHIKPILGFEAYVAPGSRHDRNAHGMKDAAYHLTLLARNNEGYRNLSRLCTAGYLEGFYYRPRIDKEILRDHAEGLIGMSGCLSGEINRHLLNGRADEAEEVAREYREIFGEDNFFLEIMNNGLEDQQTILPGVADLSRKLEIPMVATSDVHYILPEHAKVQEILLCINTGKRLDDEKRMRMDSDDFFLKSPEQMRLAFKGYEAACDRTIEIASRCNVDLAEAGILGAFHLPHIDAPDGLTDVEYMDRLCLDGLRERYGDPLPDKVIERYEKEKAVIVKMGFPSYFLMVWEIVNFARKRDIPVGTRGSAAGSIVAYALKISTLDPLEYGLLFERFLNEGRNEMPDIDLDIDKERRQEVVDFIIERFGRDQCAQIVTFGKISAKSAVRDVGRVMGVPLHEVDTVAKMIPDMVKAKDGKSSIEVAMGMNPDLKELHDKDPSVGQLLDAAGTLDGVIRQTGIHAAGVLVADKPISAYGPLAKRGDDITTQYDMKMLEKMGLCKVDCLGLETLTLLRKAVALVKETTGDEIDPDTIPLDDPETFALFGRGETKGVFQFESGGMRDQLIKLQPDCVEHLVAANAMYRPGPMQFIDTYVACRHGREEPKYLHPMMEPILRETYGLIIYQEQVQALAQELAHFNLSEGDLMRRAMGKKIKAIMDEYRSKFISQAKDTIGEKIAEEVFDLIEFFASYGFNKSHAACYAVVAYQTAYLKCHYPRPYMAALLTTNRGDTKKVVEYIDEARRMGIQVLPPDVNDSDAYFTVSGDNIRFGLSAVKGVGDRAVEGLVKEREANGAFRNLYDFCERVDLRLLNKGAIDALIKAGAFDSLGGHRAQYVAALETALSAGSQAQKDRATGQMGLFGGEAETTDPELPDVPAMESKDKLRLEKDVLGFYVSSHPLVRHEAALNAFGNATTTRLEHMPDRAQVTLGGLISVVRLRTDKNNNRYAQLVVEDLDGAVNVMVFASTFEKESVKELLEEDKIVFIQGRLDQSREEPSLIADEVIPVEQAAERLTQSIVIDLDSPGLSEDQVDALRDLLKAHRGAVPLLLRVHARNRCRVLVKAGGSMRVQPSVRLSKDIGELLGEGHIQYSTARVG